MENKTIPTAEEFCNSHLGFEEYGTDVPYFMTEFAKLHVKAALKEAMYKADTKELSSMEVNEHYREEILNSYPLENIK